MLVGSLVGLLALVAIGAPTAASAGSARPLAGSLVPDLWRYLFPPAPEPQPEPAPPSPAPSPAPAPQPAPPAPAPAPPAPAPSGPAVLRPPGSPILSDAAAANHVRRSAWEPRPENTTANRRVPTAAELSSWRGASNYARLEAGPSYIGAVTGQFTGTTDEILQWGAWKWGFDEDVLRAMAVQESHWYQSTVGDGGISFGILQLKSTVQDGTYPLSRDSTAFNVDYGAMMLRHCYDGHATWLSGGYRAGDLWGCVGWYYSGNWYDDGAKRHIAEVKQALADAAWKQPGF